MVSGPVFRVSDNKSALQTRPTDRKFRVGDVCDRERSYAPARERTLHVLSPAMVSAAMSAVMLSVCTTVMCSGVADKFSKCCTNKRMTFCTGGTVTPSVSAVVVVA